jgi:hypothetical protein
MVRATLELGSCCASGLGGPRRANWRDLADLVPLAQPTGVPLALRTREWFAGGADSMSEAWPLSIGYGLAGRHWWSMREGAGWWGTMSRVLGLCGKVA